jgi:ATP-dependent Clp protease ATP-binding subunit ClpC
MELWQRFTENSRRSVLLAHDLAARSGATQIGGAHMILGIIGLGEGQAFQRLQALPDLPELTAKLEQMASEAPTGDSENVSFTPAAQRALTRAYQKAKEEDEDSQIKTRHILAGLLQESEAAEALREAGLTED